MKRKNKRRRRKKTKGLFMKCCAATVIIQVIAYTWAHLWLSYRVGMEIAPVTSCAFYAFCGAEAGVLAWIKKYKQTDSGSGSSGAAG